MRYLASKLRPRTSSRGSSKLQLPNEVTKFRRDFPFPLDKRGVTERKRGAIFVFQHFRYLLFIPFMLCREYRRAEHVEKSVHFCFHFVPKLADRMMQSRGELD